MHIVDIIYYWARTAPLRPAIIEPSGVITYGQLAQATESAAEYFAGNIADKSRPIAISIPTGSKMLVALLGLLRGGFNVVLAYSAVFKELAAIPATTLVFERGTPTLDGGENIPFNDAVLDLDPKSTRANKPLPVTGTSIGGNILSFTSGTTGRPKLVVCPQASWQERVVFPLNPVFFNYERILIVP